MFCLLFYNISVIMKSQLCRWKAATSRPLLGRDLSRSTPAFTMTLVFCPFFFQMSSVFLKFLYRTYLLILVFGFFLFLFYISGADRLRRWCIVTKYLASLFRSQRLYQEVDHGHQPNYFFDKRSAIDMRVTSFLDLTAKRKYLIAFLMPVDACRSRCGKTWNPVCLMVNSADHRSFNAMHGMIFRNLFIWGEN